MTGRIIVLTGPPGAGKTTLAPLLVANAPGPRAVHLETDLYFRAIKKGWIAPWLRESQAQNETVLAAMTATGLAYAGGGYEVILEGIAGGWIRDHIAAACREAGVTMDYVVLCAPLETVGARVQAREVDRLDDYTPFHILHAEFCAMPEVHRVDSDLTDPEALAQEVRAGIEAGRFRLV